MTTTSTDQNAQDLQLLRSCAVAAGIIASGFFRRPVKTWEKENASPVTEADELVDTFLMQSLCKARPDYGWLSEESEDTKERLTKERTFIVDPIDGTRGFIRGDDCWAISIAVVENGVSVAGVVYAPARDELYEAHMGGGAFLNQKPIMAMPGQAGKPLIPAAGAVHKALSEVGVAFERGPSFPSLAYRLVQAATGRIDVAIARRGAQDWDIAGAAIILSECGIDFEDVCTGVPTYNKAETRHGALAALSDMSLKANVHDALRQVYGCPSEDAPQLNMEQQAT